MDFVRNNLDKTKILRYKDKMKQKYILTPSLDHEVLGNYRPISDLKVVAKLSRKLWLYISKSLKKTAFEAK